ncbi:uncharacterized protein HMPREF1541_06741 [Cyphellophora europaea CBS 101466]|uniref:Uncharacterized protein n=1 Tax=Cyphellophora europaea (strain CBS 101466) TaxID=1220924 RepID=W2RSK0_CYPE1|nr:uncharacterized protein HMPREF1541_06741 [Cyphellophora europaea CBS 101466]ETN38704.1 hypothetical protein HMPREF1541_06741 [Cyphellophora europaea CBS 101466]
MSFPYKKVLVIGATSGIGEALADKLVIEGSSVIATGRRKENLDKFVQRHGQGKTDTAVFDITQLGRIPEFVSKVTTAHDDIDCVILNSGIQRRTDWSEPETIDIETVDLEFKTNYLSYIALTKELIPFLKSKSRDTALIYISSGLALVPLPPRSNYCATKAALHQWIMSLRTSLQPTKIKVIEIYPPAVQTELHDEKHQPDIKNGRQMGMPLEDFTAEAWDGLVKGLEDIPVGIIKNTYEVFEIKRREVFGQMLQRLGMGGK